MFILSKLLKHLSVAPHSNMFPTILITFLLIPSIPIFNLTNVTYGRPISSSTLIKRSISFAAVMEDYQSEITTVIPDPASNVLQDYLLFLTVFNTVIICALVLCCAVIFIRYWRLRPWLWLLMAVRWMEMVRRGMMEMGSFESGAGIELVAIASERSENLEKPEQQGISPQNV